MLDSISHHWRRFQRQISLAVCAWFIVLWTIVRFFTKPSTYDLTTQQVLAHSWLHGYSQQIVLGSTNYLLKIFLFYMPLDLINGLPKVKLLILTTLINLVTYFLIFIAAKKILEEFKIKTGPMLYVAIIWLSMIAGSEFWIQYANSRNLEVAGALFVLLYTLKFIKLQTTKNLLWLVGLATLVFFSDSLMFYMAAAPVLIYVLTLALTKNLAWRTLGKVYTAILGSLVLSIGISKLLYRLLNITINSTSASQPVKDIHSLINSIKQAALASLRQLDGGLDAGRLYMIICLTLLGIGFLLLIKNIIKNQLPRKFVYLMFCFVVVDELIYILSGKAEQADTSRYLVMLGPIIAIGIAAISSSSIKKYLKLVGIGLIGINIILLGRTTLPTWRTREVPDQHLLSVARYINSNDYAISYGSMDTATPLAYYSNLNVGSLYPVACSGNQLVKAYSYRPELKLPDIVRAALILDNTSINNIPSSCSEAAIIKQLGEPLSIDTLEDGSLVMVYPNYKFAQLAY